MCRWSILAVLARRDNPKQPFCKFSSETEVGNEMKSWKAPYVHQLNGRDLLVVINSAISEGLPFYSQIRNLTISNGTQNAISLNAFWLNGSFFSNDLDILKEEVKTYLMAQSSHVN